MKTFGSKGMNEMFQENENDNKVSSERTNKL